MTIIVYEMYTNTISRASHWRSHLTSNVEEKNVLAISKSCSDVILAIPVFSISAYSFCSYQ